MATLTQLEYIIAVDRFKHFGRAAEHCHVSQPSLSMQIQKVEDEIGITLFDRQKKPIQSTELGRRFIEQAKVVLAETDRLSYIGKEVSEGLQGDFSLAVIPTLSPYLIPIFLEEFASSYPKVQLKIDEQKTEDIIENLKHGSLDAAILATPLEEKGLEEKVLFYEPFYLYLAESSQLWDLKTVKESDLDGSDIWLLAEGHCLRSQVIHFCSIKGAGQVLRNVQFESGNLETLRNLVRKAGGSTLLPHLFVETLPGQEVKKHIRPFRGKTPSREVSIVNRKGQFKTGIIDAIRSSVLKKIPQELIKKTSKLEVLDIN